MSKDVFGPGDRCGAHEIVRRIAEGGHGQVYLARHAEGGFRAIKTLRAQFLDIGNVRQRFDNEILLLSAIDSVHVVRVFEYGLANGHPWFAMEYLDGQPLRRVLLDAGGRLDIERAFRFGRQLARGVHAAHQLKAIHRDLKPENIIVMPGDVLKILDFGIAKIRGWAVATTGHGEGFCTPLYAAPEQIDGSGRRADARTDVYAIGVMLWEMLMGRNPFLDEDGNQPAMEITIGVKVTQPLRRIPELWRGFPEDLSEIIEKATAVQPDHRYRDAAELAAAIKDPLKRWVARARGDSLPALPQEMVALTEAVRTGEPLQRSGSMPVVAPSVMEPPVMEPPPVGKEPVLEEAPARPADLAVADTAPVSHVAMKAMEPVAANGTVPIPAGMFVPRSKTLKMEPSVRPAPPPVPPPVPASSRVTPPAMEAPPRSAPRGAPESARRRTIVAAVLGSLFGAVVCVAIVVPLLRAQNAAVAASVTPSAEPPPVLSATASAISPPPPSDTDAGAPALSPPASTPASTPPPEPVAPAATPPASTAKPAPAVQKPASATTSPRPTAPASKPAAKKSDRPVMVF